MASSGAKKALPRELLDVVRAHPGGAWLIGGAVRDILLGRKPKDFDIFVSQGPSELAEEAASRLSGKAFSSSVGWDTTSALVPAGKGSLLLDFCDVKGETIEEDARKRDFTINAMSLDLSTMELSDPLDGARDCREGALRVCSPDSFRDDPLRVVRAYRFASQLGFELLPETRALARESLPRLRDMAKERVTVEFMKALASPGSHGALELASDDGALQEVLQAKGQDLELYRRAEELLEAPPKWLRGARGWLDAPLAGERDRKCLCKLATLAQGGGQGMLRLSNEELSLLKRLPKATDAFEALLDGAPGEPELQRFLQGAKGGWPGACLLSLARSPEKGAQVARLAKRLGKAEKRMERLLEARKACYDGKDAKEAAERAGLPGGKDIGEALKALDWEFLLGRATDREGAKRFVEGFMEAKKRGQGS